MTKAGLKNPAQSVRASLQERDSHGKFSGPVKASSPVAADKGSRAASAAAKRKSTPAGNEAKGPSSTKARKQKVRFHY